MRIDLKNGVVPISYAASHLAQLIERAKRTSAPVIVTQKGYPRGVVLSIEVYEALVRAKAERE